MTLYDTMLEVKFVYGDDISGDMIAYDISKKEILKIVAYHNTFDEEKFHLVEIIDTDTNPLKIIAYAYSKETLDSLEKEIWSASISGVCRVSMGNIHIQNDDGSCSCKGSGSGNYNGNCNGNGSK